MFIKYLKNINLLIFVKLIAKLLIIKHVFIIYLISEIESNCKSNF